MPVEGLENKSNAAGARLAIRLLQDAAENGDIDPWDIDVIPVIDGFLDQLRQRIDFSERVLSQSGGTFERDLADSSEAFLAASVLVGLKAEVLESDTFPIEDDLEESFEVSFAEQGWLDPRLDLPLKPEKHLYRRPVAPPPFRRAVSLGELIEQLESIAETIEADELNSRRRRREKRFSDKQIIEQVTSLAHREKLPETTAALGLFLNNWEQALHWVDFNFLVINWKDVACDDLDTDRVGVFWALLFLSSQGKIELTQEGFLYAPLKLRRILEPGMIAQLPINQLDVTASSPAAA
ncbi:MULTISPECIES: segregation/condensation protein A [unclassified Prochlorococcus]|uniref:segregation/condensation protein A n=1 Tax=unclassified Prochlorococcus TaxID=2627481 RepID=UPI000533A592|nr:MULTISPECIES: segregation/condensation protein A [unclassified Prochlorococcus]KGG16787.1 Segregation and condensation protein A [Prochlorococcus sp. MIT 0602]KGG18239.1 Segregation and condensation protein A [Prochlorococcus sp. MIT 0603]